MSNALAIASVTQALALLIENNLRPEIDMAVSVETRKPPAEAPTEPTITVFLYQVAPNPSMRNTDLPSRTSNGALVARPTAALDLHYLISAYGEEAELVGQRLIGCVVRTLQEIPVLPRELIEAAAGRPYLAGSDLAESPQKVRFSPIQMDTDETSKLWGMLHQTPYSLSVTYQGSLVFIDGREQPVPPKPVERVNPEARPFGSPGAPGPKVPVAPQGNSSESDGPEHEDAAQETPGAAGATTSTAKRGSTGVQRPDSAAAKTPPAESSAAKTPATTGSAAKTSAAKTTAAKTPAPKSSAAKTPAARSSSARRTGSAAKSQQPAKPARSNRKTTPARKAPPPSTSDESGGATRADEGGQG